MKTFSSVADLRVALAGAPRPMGFVPTMGALHEGHATLVRRSREECATTVVSIFVNPLQFGPKEDFARYPRPIERDRALLESLRADVLFLPEAASFYPPGFSTTVDVGPLSTLFEGAVRPGHFAGVATVVTKLFLAVGADRAYFGRKDAQQVAVLRKMVRELEIPVRVVPVDTVRDADGLALSSRNVYLGAEERRQALGLPNGLFRARDAFAKGERDPARLCEIARDPHLPYDYLSCVDPDSFGPPAAAPPWLLIAAVRAGKTRLIDNLLLQG